jgi:hypothetical protein
MTDERRVGGLLLTPCHACGFIIEGARDIEETRAAPSAGSLMICLACGALSMVDQSATLGLYMRPLTPDEHRRALSDGRVVRALSARAIAQARAGDAWDP